MEPVAAEHLEGKAEKSLKEDTKEQISTNLSSPEVNPSLTALPLSEVPHSGHTGILEKSEPEEHKTQVESTSEVLSDHSALPVVSGQVSVAPGNLGLPGPDVESDSIEARVESVELKVEPLKPQEVPSTIPESLTKNLEAPESTLKTLESKEGTKVSEIQEEVKLEKIEKLENLSEVVEKLEELNFSENSKELLSNTLPSDMNQDVQEKEEIAPQEEGIQEGEEPPPPPVLFREPSSSDPEAPDSQHTYFQELGGFRVQMSDWAEANTSTYIYDDSPLSPEGLSRINKEIKALTRALPCEPSGAVFIHIDSSNLSRIKAVISGTEDTPYEHGLFLFDIKLDNTYPSSPPKMTIKTTGNGTLRFNPNLYDSGYVCLSIINTWGGDPEEMWNPSYSTLMQVFLSIQALVMNNDVIQKEPGYEGYSTNCPENRDYMTIVKYGNIKYAMIDMISNPPEEFKEIILKHFALKKDKIVESVQKWMQDLEGIGQGFGDCIVSSHNYSAITALSEVEPKKVFEDLFTELKAKLDSLPAV